MGKKKKDATAKAKDKSKIDERVKKILSIEPPDENPWKQDNENRIDSFMRYGFKKKGFEGTIREKNRLNKRERRYI